MHSASLRYQNLSAKVGDGAGTLVKVTRAASKDTAAAAQAGARVARRNAGRMVHSASLRYQNLSAKVGDGADTLVKVTRAASRDTAAAAQAGARAAWRTTGGMVHSASLSYQNLSAKVGDGADTLVKVTRAASKDTAA